MAINHLNLRELKCSSSLPFTYNSSLFPEEIHKCSTKTSFVVCYDKLLPTFARDISDNERCGWTEADLHTYLVDDITVGGHTVRDELIVRNVKQAWDFSKFAIDQHSERVLSRSYISSMHRALMLGLLSSEEIGIFRRGAVYISAAENWKCEVTPVLEETFECELPLVSVIKNPIERAVVAQLWLSYRQYFLDGNKRVARAICNALLARDMVGIFAIPRKIHRDFTVALCEFYNTAKADDLILLILNHCLFTFDVEGNLQLPCKL